MSQPVVYMSKDFFVLFCKLQKRRFDELPQSYPYFHKLIFHTARVFISLEPYEIYRISGLQQKDIIKEESEDEQILYGNLKILIEKNTVRSCKEEIEIFREKDYSSFNDLERKPHFIFIDDTKENCKEIGDEFGVICISPLLELHEDNTTTKILDIDADCVVNYSEELKYLPKCNSIIIEDPYLFHDDPDGIFLGNLLKTLIKDNIPKVICFITLIFSVSDSILGDNRKYKNLTNEEKKANKKENEQKINDAINRLKQSITNKIEIYKGSTFSSDPNRLHDRYIYSNSFWINCGLGFKERYNALTSWDIRPLGTNFNGYDKRLCKVAEHQRYKISENYLMTQNGMR